VSVRAADGKVSDTDGESTPVAAPCKWGPVQQLTPACRVSGPVQQPTPACCIFFQRRSLGDS
jgi:hypothetical protein